MGAPSPNENNSQKGLALLLCLFMVYLYKEMVWDPYFDPQAMRQASQPAASSSSSSSSTADRFAEPPVISPTGEPAAPAAQPPAVKSQPQTGYPTDAQIADRGIVILESDKIRLAVSLLGGRVIELRLKDFASTMDAGSPPINLVDHVESAPYPLGVYNGAENDAWVAYSVTSGQQVSTPGAQLINQSASGPLVMSGTLPDGRTITKSISPQTGGYFVDVSVTASAPSADSSRLALEWTRLISKDSPSLLDPYNGTSYVWFDGQKALREALNKLPADQQDLSGIIWLSMSDKYFTATLLSSDGPTMAKVLKTGELYRTRLMGAATEQHAQLFAGPKSLRVLEDAGHELQRNIDFGRTGIISAPLVILMHKLHDYLGNFGLAIVVLTIIVKMAMYPLTASSFKQMKKMQDLAPELKKIRENVPDKQQQQLETMQLYKSRGVNPLGGCFPILLQMPVFIGLYSAIQLDTELRHAPFALWIQDLSAPEKMPFLGVGIPVMVILFVISMLVQQWTTPTAVDPAQKKAMMIMPLVMGFLFAKMPAGLTLYWLTNNLISIGQQSGLRKSSASALQLTLGVATAVFLFAFALTKIG